MRMLYKLFVLSTILILQSCYTRYTNNLLQDRKSLPQYDKVDVTKYRLKVNDELVIRVLSTNESIIKIYCFATINFTAIYLIPPLILLNKLLIMLNYYEKSD